MESKRLKNKNSRQVASFYLREEYIRIWNFSLFRMILMYFLEIGGCKMDIVTLARIQFAMTTIFHFFFVPFSIGTGVVVAIMETLYVIKKKMKNIAE